MRFIPILILAAAAFGQSAPAPAAAPTPSLLPIPTPSGVAFYAEYNQLSTASTNWAFGASAAYSTTGQSKIRMFNTSAVDFVPVKGTDPATGKTFVGFSGQFRQGVHEQFIHTPAFSASFGVDAGPGLSSTPAGVTLSATGSFDVTMLFRLNSYLSLIMPLRMLYISNIGNGTGAFNPVGQIGLMVNLKKLPASN